ncbi:hypothetical protein PNOK_0658300 [Pyrrhoderma noxium]|uniref:Uncharacterized protein n=1 Tax=Pyrrhoderma noxium TaxID=2282107 RepID=A0A286UEU4_9AGAM|nr:hypothetical protein PNOK_0658300 [Pyrrhoderma noxium]
MLSDRINTACADVAALGWSNTATGEHCLLKFRSSKSSTPKVKSYWRTEHKCDTYVGLTSPTQHRNMNATGDNSSVVQVVKKKRRFLLSNSPQKDTVINPNFLVQ